jgi:alpha-beta hydrolase superfamily lysophospholipase
MHGTGDKLAYSKCTEKISKEIKPELCTLRLWTGLSHELHNEPEKAEVLAFLIEHLDRFIARVA